MTYSAANDDHDNRLMDELRIRDEKLTKDMYENLLDTDDMQNVLLKKLQLYNEIEVSLNESRNKLIVAFMKIAVENRMMITHIKRDMDEQVAAEPPPPLTRKQVSAKKMFTDLAPQQRVA